MVHSVALQARDSTFWVRSAPGRISQPDLPDDVIKPLGSAALDWLSPQPGQRIVDVGCGRGDTTAELAAAVGPAGDVTGVDLSEAMVTSARDRYPDIRFVAADVEALGALPGAPFDAAFSRMTLMLLADPVAGSATIRRSLRPEGRLAATVLRDSAANPWLSTAMLGAAPFLEPLPPGDGPGPFALADPSLMIHTLVTAGFSDIAILRQDVFLNAPDEPRAVAEWLIRIGPIGAAYLDASDPDQASARLGAARRLEQFREPGVGYRLPAGCWLATAVAPG